MLSLLCTPGLLLYKAHVDTQSLMTMSYNTEQSVQFGRHMPVGQLPAPPDMKHLVSFRGLL